MYGYLGRTEPRPTPGRDGPPETVQEASRKKELVTELRKRIQFVETELADRKEESRRKDHIIAALTQRIPELESASEPRGYPERLTEHVDRGTTSTIESGRPRWVLLLGDLISSSRQGRRRVRRG